jgi:subtilisin family serine protease
MLLLRGRIEIADVEPNYIIQTTALPNDPLFPSLWGLYNAAHPGADIHARGAWAVSTGSLTAVVGDVDTGVDYTHPDLAGNMWTAPSAFTVTIGGTSLTCPAGSHGFNAIAFAAGDGAHACDPADDHGHGTHTSGTIGAIGNNSLGVVGVNWTTRIMGLKFLDATGSGSTSNAVNAIEFAVRAKAAFSTSGGADVRVLSNSWTSSGSSTPLLQEILRAGANEMLFVVAAGNSSSNNDVAPVYPAAYSSPNMIAVAATTDTDTLAAFSDYGSSSVHLGAPGVSITSTLPGGSYGSASGTSMATPHVSGAAALVLSACSLTTTQLKSTILDNVDVVTGLSGVVQTNGRLNVDKAIRSCAVVPNQPPAVTLTAPADGATFVAPANIPLSASATDDDGIARVEFYSGSTLIATSMVSPYTATWSGVAAGNYTLTAVAYDTTGASSTSAAARVSVQPQTGTLPSPWTAQDIGAVGAPGSASGSGTAFSVTGAGDDIWGTDDAFQFVYQPLTGDGQIVARVVGMGNTNQWAKAGIMLRASSASNAANVLLDQTPSGSVEFLERSSAGSSTFGIANASLGFPTWLRLVRSGSSVTASVSSDGGTWSTVGTATLPISGSALVGLAVTSHNASLFNTATFDNVTVTAGVPPPSGVPSPWTAQDIGAVGAAGSASGSGTGFSVTGAGGDIWGTDDAFQFVYQPLTGDGQIVARVVDMGNTNQWAKAGIMLRASSASNAANVLLDQTPSGSVEFLERSSAGSSTFGIANASLGFPTWLRLVRSGNSVTASVSSDGVTWSTVGTATLTISGSALVGLAVTSHDPALLNTATFDNVTVTAGVTPPSGVPSPWTAQDVGAVGAAGSASGSGTAFSVTGAGGDIWGTDDAFQFVYQPLTGDGEIVARVAAMQYTDEWAKAGVMIREDLTPGSRHGMVVMTPGHGVAFQRRTVTGDATTHTAGAEVAPPHWVKLLRTGSLLTAYDSTDGNTWTLIGSDVIAMPPTVYVGLAVTSHSYGVPCTAAIDNVAISIP